MRATLLVLVILLALYLPIANTWKISTYRFGDRYHHHAAKSVTATTRSLHSYACSCKSAQTSFSLRTSSFEVTNQAIKLQALKGNGCMCSSTSDTVDSDCEASCGRLSCFGKLMINVAIKLKNKIFASKPSSLLQLRAEKRKYLPSTHGNDEDLPGTMNDFNSPDERLASNTDRENIFDENREDTSREKVTDDNYRYNNAVCSTVHTQTAIGTPFDLQKDTIAEESVLPLSNDREMSELAAVSSALADSSDHESNLSFHTQLSPAMPLDAVSLPSYQPLTLMQKGLKISKKMLIGGALALLAGAIIRYLSSSQPLSTKLSSIEPSSDISKPTEQITISPNSNSYSYNQPLQSNISGDSIKKKIKPKRNQNVMFNKQNMTNKSITNQSEKKQPRKPRNLLNKRMSFSNTTSELVSEQGLSQQLFSREQQVVSVLKEGDTMKYESNPMLSTVTTDEISTVRDVESGKPAEIRVPSFTTDSTSASMERIDRINEDEVIVTDKLSAIAAVTPTSINDASEMPTKNNVLTTMRPVIISANKKPKTQPVRRLATLSDAKDLLLNLGSPNHIEVKSNDQNKPPHDIIYDSPIEFYNACENEIMTAASARNIPNDEIQDILSTIKARTSELSRERLITLIDKYFLPAQSYVGYGIAVDNLSELSLASVKLGSNLDLVSTALAFLWIGCNKDWQMFIVESAWNNNEV